MSQAKVRVKMDAEVGRAESYTGLGKDRFDAMIDALYNLSGGRISTGDKFEITYTEREVIE